jgi:hypothetical protein
MFKSLLTAALPDDRSHAHIHEGSGWVLTPPSPDIHMLGFPSWSERMSMRPSKSIHSKYIRTQHSSQCS